MDGLTLLGQGREAEVFGLPDGSVLKLMRDTGTTGSWRTYPSERMASILLAIGSTRQ